MPRKIGEGPVCSRTYPAGEVRGAQLSNRRKAGAAFFIAEPHKKAKLGQPPECL